MISEHRELVELIPWYVNGTLPAAERAALERHCKSCLPCRSALKEEQRLRRLMQAQSDLPLTPEHGIGGLLARIDGSRAARRARSKAPIVGYGVAAALGGALVWLVLVIAPEPSGAPFTTLSAPATSVPGRIDVVFTEPIGEAALRELVADLGGELVGGPSEIGRYTIALPKARAADLDTVLAALRDDSRIAFAGPSFIGDADIGAAEPAGATP